MKKTLSIFIFLCFLITSIIGPNPVFAQDTYLPTLGGIVHLSPEFNPSILKGITIHPENPLMFDFIIYRGDKVLSDQQKQEEYKKLIKYFLASLAIPDEDQWVNLSPYEKNRIIKDDFGKTLMGRDLLAQDYILKQITASLIYPEEDLGKKFWDKVYAKAQQQYGTTNIPVNTFNKVWIIPDDALIYEKGNTAYVLKNHLRVMLEEDYLSLEKHSGIASTVIPAMVRQAHHASNHAERSRSKAGIQNENNINALGSQVVREIILPALEKEVNTAKNFALLRQVYSGMLLAAWFKRTLRKSILGQIYADKTKIKGVDQDPKNNEAIYQCYLRAYKKGVFNYIKEDVNKYANEAIPRKYFSGGAEAYLDFAKTVHFVSPLIGDLAMAKDARGDDDALVSLDKAMALKDAAVLSRRKFLTIGGVFASWMIFTGGKIATAQNTLFNKFFKRALAFSTVDSIRNTIKILKDNPSLSASRLLDSDEQDPYMRFLSAMVEANKDSAYDAILEIAPADPEIQNIPKEQKKRRLATAFGIWLLRSYFHSQTELKDLGFFRNMLIVADIEGINPDYLNRLNAYILYALLYNGYLIVKIPMEPQKAERKIEQIIQKKAAGDEIDRKILAGSHSPEAEKSIQSLKSKLIKYFLDSPENAPLWPMVESVLSPAGQVNKAMLASNLLEPGNIDLKAGDAAMDGIGIVKEQTSKSIFDFLEEHHFYMSRHPNAAMTTEVIGRAKRAAEMTMAAPGGIDLNAANLAMIIKRDGKGVPLPLAQQDLAQLNNIEGLDPVILSIKPASQTPLFSQLQTSP